MKTIAKFLILIAALAAAPACSPADAASVVQNSPQRPSFLPGMTGQMEVAYIVGPIDYTTTGSYQVVPAITGYSFLASSIQALIISTTGTISASATANISAANSTFALTSGPNFPNVTSITQAKTSAAPTYQSGSAGASPVTTFNTPLTLNVTAPLTCSVGPCTLLVKVIARGNYF